MGGDNGIGVTSILPPACYYSCSDFDFSTMHAYPYISHKCEVNMNKTITRSNTQQTGRQQTPSASHVILQIGGAPLAPESHHPFVPQQRPRTAT